MIRGRNGPRGRRPVRIYDVAFHRHNLGCGQRWRHAQIFSRIFILRFFLCLFPCSSDIAAPSTSVPQPAVNEMSGEDTEPVGRSPYLPTIEEVTSHPRVKAPHGPIFIVKGREDKEWMGKLLEHVAVKKCPKDRADAGTKGKSSILRDLKCGSCSLSFVATGYKIVRADAQPVFLWRNMAGSQKPEDDKIKVWTRPG